MARVALDPAVWQQIRIAAVEDGTTASALANTVLSEWVKRRSSRGQKAGPTNNSDGAPHSATPPTEDPWKDLSTAAGKLIETPQEAALRAAEITVARPREIHPVPKPTSKARPSRRSMGKSS